MDKKRIIKRIKEEFLFFLKALDMNENAYLGPYGQIILKRRMPRSTYYEKIRRFEKQGLLKRQKTQKGTNFIITQKAKYLRRRPAIKQSRKDGFSTLVIFDIPQEKRNARDTLRRYLIRNGYTLIRESCFLSPFKISADLSELLHELKLEKNVTILMAKVEYLLKPSG